MKLETILSPIKTYEQIRLIALEAFNDVEIGSVDRELQKVIIKSGSDIIPVMPSALRFKGSDVVDESSKGIINIDLLGLTNLDWRGIPENEIKFEIQALIIRDLVLQTRSKITGNKSDTRLENIIAEYVTRDILKRLGYENRLLRFFEWTDNESINDFDYLIIALMKESDTTASLQIKNALVKSFFDGTDFTTEDYLDSLPEKTRLLFLELLKSNEDKTYQKEYVDDVFRQYNVASKQYYATRVDRHYEHVPNLTTEAIKETVLEVFQDIGWEELVTIYNEFRGRLGLNKVEYSYPDFVKFIYSEEGFSMQVQTNHSYSFDNNGGIAFTFQDDDNLVVYVNMRSFYDTYHRDTDTTRLKNDLDDIFIHELNHFYAGRPTKVFHNDTNKPNEPNLVQGTGISKAWHCYFIDPKDGLKKSWKDVWGDRLNEVLTELGAQWLQNHYRPKTDGSHTERSRSYLKYVDAFGVLVLALHNYSGVGVKEIIAGFFHNYFGPDEIYNNKYLEDVINAISNPDPRVEEEMRDAVGLVLLELLGSDLKTITDEYVDNLARKFNVNVELAREIHRYI